VNVALFHGSERSLLPRQEGEKQPHAPFEAQEIARGGLRHAFLGHFHFPADEESYTYPGNPDPLTFGEEGERALVIAEITSDGIVHRERQRVAVTRVHDLELDVTGCTSRQDVRGRAESLLRARNGMARVTVVGDLEPSIDLLPQDIVEIGSHLEAVLVRFGKIGISYDFEALAAEPTVRGEFVRDVRSGRLDSDFERRVLVTGLRALEGRKDLEVL
jgi:DNA repair exonuclease SbcCD nuclease subunit